jgi:hypothetical protein
VRRVAGGLSLVAIVWSGSASAQLNNETSPTHQFKSVGSYISYKVDSGSPSWNKYGLGSGTLAIQMLTTSPSYSDPTCTRP